VKLLFHSLLILATGIVLGLMIRSMRTGSDAAPDLADQVFTDAGEPAKSASEIENSEPTRPPADEAWLSQFVLTERSGEIIRSEDLKGQPYVVSFFFSLCPSICVQQNQKLAELQEEFDGQPVRFVAISVDPENDTPERLREYAARFGADANQWLFLTGDLTYIRRIGTEIFKQPVNKQFHTERFALVDPAGEIEGFYNWPEKRQMAKLRETIRDMISKIAPPAIDSENVPASDRANTNKDAT
jgi:protein SCO1/2